MGQTGVAQKDDVQDLKVHIDTKLEALKEAMEAKLESKVDSLKEMFEGIIIFFGLFGK